MDITKFAVEKTRVIIVLLAIIIFGGFAAYINMPRAEDPGFLIRTAIVTTLFPGANPERVELLVTDKIEKIVQEMPELDYLESRSKSGISIIYVNVKEKYKDLQPIWDKLRRKVQRAQMQLPDNTLGPFVNDEFGDVFGSIITITAEGYSYRELKDIADDVRDDLLRIENVAKVDIHGIQEERIFLEYKNARLAEFGVSPSQLSQILNNQNILFSGGDVKINEERIVLEPTGNFDSVDDIKKTVINIPGRSGVIFLEDIVEIKRGYIDPQSEIVRSTGADALILAISLKEGGNIIDLGADLKNAVARLQADYPIGVEFDTVSFQPGYVEGLINDFIENLVQSIVIVIALMLVFLGARVGILVASLIPVSILMAFLIMSNFGIGIEKISLAALIISLGMLVDNAIVMSESIMVKMREGQKALDAILNSSRELKKPLLIATLATSSAFLPIFLAKSAVGEFCSSLFKVVSITLLSSWILALTIIPAACYYFLKLKPASENESVYDNKYYTAYRNFLIKLLKNPIRSLCGILVIFFIAMYGFKFVPKMFFPDSDRPTFIVEAKVPYDSDIGKTNRVIASVENYLKENHMVNDERKEGVTNWFSVIGKGAPRFILSYSPEPPAINFGTIIVNVTSFDLVADVIKDVRDYMNSTFPDVEATVKKPPLGPPANYPVEILISGKDERKIFEITDRVKAKLREIEGTTLITDDWGARIKKIVVDIDPVRAQRAGVTNKDIAVSLQSAFSGLNLSQYREEDELIPITLRTTKNYREGLGKIESINVYSQMTGKSVPLSQVASIKPEWQPSRIMRRDRLRTVTVQSLISEDANAIAIAMQAQKWLDEVEAPTWDMGYYWDLGGIVEKSQDGNKSIGDKLPITGLLIFLLLVIQFNSLRKTAVVLCTLPLALIGVTFGLLVAKSYFGFITLLGIISLAGIVTNNAVVLIDRIKLESEVYKDDPARAIVVAAQKRARPILLTATTTIGGLIPLWLGGGPMFQPMAITIIFGLAFASLLTLGVVPVLYSLFYRIDFRKFEYNKPKAKPDAFDTKLTEVKL